MPRDVTTIDPARRALGAALREIRGATPLAVCAARIGSTYQRLYDWESGRRSPRLSELPDAARAYDASPLRIVKIFLGNIPHSA